MSISTARGAALSARGRSATGHGPGAGGGRVAATRESQESPRAINYEGREKAKTIPRHREARRPPAHAPHLPRRQGLAARGPGPGGPRPAGPAGVKRLGPALIL